MTQPRAKLFGGVGAIGLIRIVALGALVCMAAAGCRSTAVQLPAVPVADETTGDAYAQVERLTEVMLNIRKNYVDPKTYKEIMDGALEGMLRALDEHSHYLDADQFKQIQEETSGEFGGVGIWVGVKENALVVIAPMEDTPAFRAGLMSQDAIVEIDGTNTVGMSIEDAVKKLRGPPGTKVTLKIKRQSEPEPKVIELTREQIEVPSVKGARMIREGVGYVRITQFSAPTAQLLQPALDKLFAEGMDALVLDLRSNPGGLLSSAVEVAEKFLKKGDAVVIIKGRGEGNIVTLPAGNDRHYTDLAIAILVNGGTASASEIVSGALQDHRRAILVGQQTFGKGSVQSVIRLNTDQDAGIRLTTARYLTPSGREIHKVGIEPDIVAPVSTKDWQNILTRRAQIENPNTYTQEEKAKYENVTDPQLERAADLLEAIRTYKKHVSK